ncbi:unnamed protein product [Mytilus edulis]|uniref:B box-type domain-containing protein n=1 Tax=Mytilus edulis TaxID=6550 RepID=A0A8S3UNN1_MYTED|nr:unnamed protein product [Mytilus edulis]
MATCTSVCVVCDLQHQTTQSTYWCIECEEPLCSDCKAHHNVLKATEITKQFLYQITNYYQLLQRVKYRKSNRSKEENSCRSLSLEKSGHPASQYTRRGVHKKLEQIEFDCCDPIRVIVSSLQDKAKEINQFKSEIKNTKNMKKYASNLQTFLSLRKIQNKTTEYEQDLQYCNENEYNETINIESTIDTKIQDILTVDIFGSINVKKSLSKKFDLQRRKDRQAQIVLHKPIKLINDVKLKFKRKTEHSFYVSYYSITTIPNTASSWYSYVSTHGDKIFFTTPDKETVTCCLYSGALVWEFKDERVIKSPQGITVDNNGVIFVVGNHSCNVVAISPDGKQCKQILTKKDGLDGPTAIFVDKVRNLLLVTNENRFAYMYDVSYV